MNKLVYGLKLIICGVLCIVSMVLTACFALSFGSSSAQPNTIMAVVSPLILITIGVVIDSSKYIFWGTRGSMGSWGYTVLAVVLMAFSWMASVAFFISNEEIKLTTYRKQTAQYIAFEAELASINNIVAQKTEQSQKRLDSRFHNQWDKSEALTQNISDLEDKRSKLLLLEPTIGLAQSQKNLVSMAFFRSVASITNVDSNTIRNGFYGVLALLIEVCAFGLITLCRKEEKREVEELISPFGLLEKKSDRVLDELENNDKTLSIEEEDKPLSSETPKELTLSTLVQKERARNRKKNGTSQKTKNENDELQLN